jgi:alpha-tubulin suppressor-like RCC1 family protein
MPLRAAKGFCVATSRPALRFALVLVAALATSPASARAATGFPAVAWGANHQTQLGSGYRSGRQLSPVPVLGLSNITSLEAGYHFSLALLSDGTLRAWGGNDKGQLGDGSREETGTPAEVLGLHGVTQIAVGGLHDLALLKNGTVWSWGAAEYGERGNGESGFESEAKEKEPNYPPRDVPAQVPSLEHVVAINAAGPDLALLENGTLMAWGEDVAGALGLGESGPEECKGEVGVLPCSTIPRPVKLPEGAKVVSMSGGGEGAYVLLNTGEMLAWGNNGHGQLGNGSTTATSTPTKVDLPKLEEELKTKLEVVSLSGGNLFALALLRSGEVVGWGANGVGELGGTSSEECKGTPNSCSKTPKLVSGLAEVSSVSAGRSFSLVLKRGTIYSFGINEPWGQLGIGSLTNTNVPTPVKGISPVTVVNAGEQHSLALVEGGPPPPEFAVTPLPGALKVTWTINASEYHIRWKTPPKTGKWSPIVKRKGPCSSEHVCSYVIEGLRKEPYEVDFTLVNEGKIGEKRHAIATPE